MIKIFVGKGTALISTVTALVAIVFLVSCSKKQSVEKNSNANKSGKVALSQASKDTVKEVNFMCGTLAQLLPPYSILCQN